MSHKEDFYSVLKRVLLKRAGEKPTAKSAPAPIISLSEQLSILARVNRQREERLTLPEQNKGLRRTNREIVKAYSA